MSRKTKAICALLMVLCMLFGTASASIIGLDESLSTYLDLNDDVHFTFGMEIRSLMPYGEATVEMLNGVLKHMSVGGSLIGDGSGSTTAFSLGVDGESVLDVSETEDANGTALVTSLLKNRKLTSVRSAMDALSGSEAGEEAEFDILRAITDARGCYKELTDAIIPYAEEKKANYNIKSIGRSRWSRIARLTVEQGEELAPLIAQMLGCGMDAAYRERLSQLACQKGFVVGLYQAEQGGKDMAVYMKGTLTLADGEAYKLSYQWAFVDGGTERKDSYKFELVKSKSPSDNRLVSAAYTQKEFTDRFSIDGKCETTLKNPEGTVVTTVRHELSGSDQQGVRDVTGTLATTVKTTAKGDTETTVSTYKPALKLTSAEGSGVLSGTVELEKKVGKNVTTDVLFTFDDEPAEALIAAARNGDLYAVTADEAEVVEPTATPVSSLIQNEEIVEGESPNDYLVGKTPIGLETYAVPSTVQTVDLDSASEAELESLLGELSQNLAGRLLIVLSKLPQEDVALLKDNMSEENYAAFLTLISGL